MTVSAGIAHFATVTSLAAACCCDLAKPAALHLLNSRSADAPLQLPACYVQLANTTVCRYGLARPVVPVVQEIAKWEMPLMVPCTQVHAAWASQKASLLSRHRKG